MEFTPIRLHTRYSPLLSLIEPVDLARWLEASGLPVAAVVDRGVLFGFAETRAALGSGAPKLAGGAELLVRFPRRGGGYPPPAYTLTLFPESSEGRENLVRLLDAVWDSRRPSLLRGIAEMDELEQRSVGLIALSGGATGPLSGAYARGRVGDARRIASLLFDLFGRGRFFIEIDRSGQGRGGLARPFLDEIARSFRLDFVAADPVRYFRAEDRPLWERLRGLAPEGGEGLDPRVSEGPQHLPSPQEISALYGDDPSPLRKAREVAERAAVGWEASEVAKGKEGEIDELIRSCLTGLRRVYGEGAHWRRKTAESRFWDEFWKLDERGLLSLVARLSRLFASLRRADRTARVSTPFLSGSLVGFAAGLHDIDPGASGCGPELPFPAPAERGFPLRIDADRKGESLLRKILLDRYDGFLRLLLEPVYLRETTPRPGGEESGPRTDPPNSRPSDENFRGNRGSDPLPRGDWGVVEQRAIQGYKESANELLWMEEKSDAWGCALSNRAGPWPVRLRLRQSSLANVLRATREIGGEGDPCRVLRKGLWVGMVEGEPPLSSRLVRAVAPRSFEDVVLLLSAPEPRGPRSDLLKRILEVRRGSRKPPLAVPRLEAILAETEGVPFYQEQFVALIREMGGVSRQEAEEIYLSLRDGRGAEVARDRSLILRRALDRGFSVAMAGRAFSVLLSLAPHAVRRGEVVPRARVLWEIARRKDSDPLSFAVALLNDVLHKREKMRELARGFRREGIPFLPIHRNRSDFAFTVEEEALRTGLAAVPGMTEQLFELYALERKEGGEFRSPTDILERMAGRDFPRTLLLELVRMLQERETIGEKGAVHGAGGSRKSGAGQGKRGTRIGTRPIPPGRRRRGGEGQSSFAFFEESREDRGARTPVRSDKKRGRR